MIEQKPAEETTKLTNILMCPMSARANDQHAVNVSGWVYANEQKGNGAVSPVCAV